MPALRESSFSGMTDATEMPPKESKVMAMATRMNMASG